MANPAPQDEDDLLTPSLGAHDDVVGFDRPWNPNYLVLVGAFFGLVPMGFLLAVNFKQLGRPAAFVPTLVLATAAGVGLTLLSGYAWLHGLPGLYDAGNPDHRRGLKLGVQALTIAVGLAVAHRQRKRWELFQAHGGEGGALLLPALGAIVVGVGLQLLVAAPFVAKSAGGGTP